MITNMCYDLSFTVGWDTYQAAEYEWRGSAEIMCLKNEPEPRLSFAMSCHLHAARGLVKSHAETVDTVC